MIIPGVLISLVTFPGVVIHELAHQLFCMLCGLKVYEVKYFQINNPNGYVIYQSFKSSAWLAGFFHSDACLSQQGGCEGYD